MTLHKVDVTKIAPVESLVVGTPDIGFVAIADLVIDDSYQREMGLRGCENVRRIAANFDWAKFSPLMVARRADGTFAIIDGQHRAHAAALCGISEVPAMFSELSQQKQAEAFSWINGVVTALTQPQIFKAALMAFEPWAVQCDAVVSRAGCQLMTYNASAAKKKPGQVFCISVVRKFVELGQSAQIATVLRAVLNSSVATDVRYVNSFGLTTLVPAVLAAGITRPEVLTAFLDEHSLDKIARRVERIRELPEHKGRSFRSLFVDSVTAMLKAHAAGKLEAA